MIGFFSLENHWDILYNIYFRKLFIICKYYLFDKNEKGHLGYTCAIIYPFDPYGILIAPQVKYVIMSC